LLKTQPVKASKTKLSNSIFFGCPDGVSETKFTCVATTKSMDMTSNEVEVLDARERSKVDQLVRVKGVDFEENFVANLISNYFKNMGLSQEPRLSDALAIYLTESRAADGQKFRNDTVHAFRRFELLLGDMALSELRHVHACTFRDYLLGLGLSPVTVRKQSSILNAMLNLAFRYLDIDRLSPFRALRIAGEETRRPMRVITAELLEDVKNKLANTRARPYKLIGLIQLNTGMRVSEPVYARLEDCVLDHPIPHLWVRRNELAQRKTPSSIRAVPLLGVSLMAAKKLYYQASVQGSEWLVPSYARYHGSNSCSAMMCRYLAEFEFRSHMFRHALIDRMKACNDIPTRLAESITGHSSGGSDFNTYGTVGYTLEQKEVVLRRIAL
jgi:integrase